MTHHAELAHGRYFSAPLFEATSSQASHQSCLSCLSADLSGCPPSGASSCTHSQQAVACPFARLPLPRLLAAPRTVCGST